jgi:ABC-2 type transport system permease protein
MKRLGAVIRRELRRLPRFPVLWALLLPLPAAAVLLLAGVFAEETAYALPVGVLDFDGTPAAREVLRWVETTRTVHVASRVEDLGAAQELILQGGAYAVLVIPRHFERDLLHGRSPRVTLLYNQQYLTAGSLIAGDVAAAVNGASAAVAFREKRAVVETRAAATAQLEPVRVDSRILFNPGVSYARGVAVVLVVGLLQVVIALSTAYAVGRELRDATAGEWLAAAGGSRLLAWLGKMGLYFAVHLALMLLLVGGFLAWFHIPVRGPGSLALGGVAFVLACQAIAVLVVAWTANLRMCLGICSFFFAPAIAFSGVTFPWRAMTTAARAWGSLVPLTHVMVLVREQVMVGAPARVSMPPLLTLAATAVIAGLLSLPRAGRVLSEPSFWGRE